MIELDFEFKQGIARNASFLFANLLLDDLLIDLCLYSAYRSKTWFEPSLIYVQKCLENEVNKILHTWEKFTSTCFSGLLPLKKL